MGLFSDLGLGAARRMRARLGARGALRMLLPMIAASPPSPARAAAILVGLECAIEADDELAFDALALGWGAEREGARTADAARLCASMIAVGRTDRAVALADAEVVRRDRRASRALRAVAREANGAIDGAAEDWQAVAAEADRMREGTNIGSPAPGPPVRTLHALPSGPSRGEHSSLGSIASTARIELARLLSTQPGHRLRAARVAAEIDEEPSSARAQLIVAIARLGESGRYARVRGLDALVALARGADPIVARAAIRAACAHVDTSGAALTSVEIDRVRCAASAWPDERERARLIAVLDTVVGTLEGDVAARSTALVRAASASADTHAQLARARAVLSGDTPGPRPANDDGTWSALMAIAAMRRGRDDEARERLRELASVLTDGAPAAWTAAWMGLDRPGTRAAATALASALLATRRAPPRGFAALASHLERAGAGDLARAALTRAHEQREPGARPRHVEALLRAAWTAHREGRRDEAIRLLREAKA